MTIAASCGSRRKSATRWPNAAAPSVSRPGILEYEIRDADSPDFHALISNAEIVEISLTDRPANSRALVLSRTPTAPTAPFIQAMGQQTNLAIRAVGLIQRQLEVLQQQLSQAPSPPAPSAAQPPARRPAAINPPRQPTPFKQLVEAINGHLQ